MVASPNPEPQPPAGPLSPERLAEIKDLLLYESSIAFYSHRAKESLLLLVADYERTCAELAEYRTDLGEICHHIDSPCDCPNAPDPVQAYHAMRESRDALRNERERLLAVLGRTQDKVADIAAERDELRAQLAAEPRATDGAVQALTDAVRDVKAESGTCTECGDPPSAWCQECAGCSCNPTGHGAGCPKGGA